MFCVYIVSCFAKVEIELINHVRNLSSLLTGRRWLYSACAWNYARRGTWGLPHPLKLNIVEYIYAHVICVIRFKTKKTTSKHSQEIQKIKISYSLEWNFNIMILKILNTLTLSWRIRKWVAFATSIEPCQPWNLTRLYTVDWQIQV